MSYRVCIPCAGTGSRLGGITKYINKSLVSIAHRPVLAHLIEQFPDDTEFVIALGHKGNLVREFIKLAYPQRTFFFVEVDPFEGPNSGLGLSLLMCSEYLQQPFIFTSCDTLVLGTILPPNSNWIGYANVSDSDQYRTLVVDEGICKDICEKNQPGFESRRAYIGIAGIKNYQEFWHAMKQGGSEAIAGGESHGLKVLIERGFEVQANEFKWFDTGNPQALAITADAYKEPDAPNILEKSNEAIWFLGNRVIKFSDDQRFIVNRVERAKRLKGFVPDIIDSSSHMYSYCKVEGSVLSEVITLPMFKSLLEHCEYFWAPAELNDRAQLVFYSSCRQFYKDKTLERVDLFYKNFCKIDSNLPINGVDMPTLSTLLEEVDWEWLSKGTPGRFHGDFHFENILWNNTTNHFSFLDWRQDFAGDLDVGDIYYDLAKLLHGLIVSHGLIAHGHYSVSWSSTRIDFDLHRTQVLVECERQFGMWLDEKGYDKQKVGLLTSIIYLNIAALHHHPYCLLLYALGKSMLRNCLREGY